MFFLAAAVQTIWFSYNDLFSLNLGELFVRPLKLLSWALWRILQTELFAVMVMILGICMCLMGIPLKDLQCCPVTNPSPETPRN